MLRVLVLSSPRDNLADPIEQRLSPLELGVRFGSTENSEKKENKRKITFFAGYNDSFKSNS